MLLKYFLCCSSCAATSIKFPGLVDNTKSLALEGLIVSSAPANKHSRSNATPAAAIATCTVEALAISLKTILLNSSSLSKNKAWGFLRGLTLLKSIVALEQSAPAHDKSGSASRVNWRIGGRDDGSTECKPSSSYASPENTCFTSPPISSTTGSGFSQFVDKAFDISNSETVSDSCSLRSSSTELNFLVFVSCDLVPLDCLLISLMPVSASACNSFVGLPLFFFIMACASAPGSRPLVGSSISPQGGERSRGRINGTFQLIPTLCHFAAPYTPI